MVKTNNTTKTTKTTKTKAKKGGKKRKPSKYNLFMKNELPKYKKAHPTATHQQAFKAIAASWTKNK